MSYYNPGDLSEEDFAALDAEELAYRKVEDDELHALYTEWLDDSYGDVQIAGGTYSTSRALAELDPIAYRTGFSDWLDSEIQDGNIVEL